jgi:hypothetical protein
VFKFLLKASRAIKVSPEGRLGLGVGRVGVSDSVEVSVDRVRV